MASTRALQRLPLRRTDCRKGCVRDCSASWRSRTITNRASKIVSSAPRRMCAIAGFAGSARRMRGQAFCSGTATRMRSCRPSQKLPRAPGATALFAGGEACPPLLGVTTPRPGRRAFNDAVAALARDPNIVEVILEARWGEIRRGLAVWQRTERPCRAAERSGRSDRRATITQFSCGDFRGRLANSQAGTSRSSSWPPFRKSAGPCPLFWRDMPLRKTHNPLRPASKIICHRQKFVLDAFAQVHQKFGATILYPHHSLCATGACEVERRNFALLRRTPSRAFLAPSSSSPSMRQSF